MVAQKASRQQPRVQKGNSGIPREMLDVNAGGDNAKSTKSKEHIRVTKEDNHARNSQRVNRHARSQPNAGSRFNVLEDIVEMETDRGDDKSGNEKEKGNVDVDESEDEVVMETLNSEEEHRERANVSISHTHLAENIRPLEKTDIVFRAQAQGTNSGPRMRSDKALKDLTNKLEPKPSIAKMARPGPGLKSSVGNKDIKILKRPAEAWRQDGSKGLPNKSPYDNSLWAKNNHMGRVDLTKPPDPPDIRMREGDSLNPRVESNHSKLGAAGEGAETPDPKTSSSDLEAAGSGAATMDPATSSSDFVMAEPAGEDRLRRRWSLLNFTHD